MFLLYFIFLFQEAGDELVAPIINPSLSLKGSQTPTPGSPASCLGVPWAGLTTPSATLVAPVAVPLLSSPSRV